MPLLRATSGQWLQPQDSGERGWNPVPDHCPSHASGLWRVDSHRPEQSRALVDLHHTRCWRFHCCFNLSNRKVKNYQFSRWFFFSVSAKETLVRPQFSERLKNISVKQGTLVELAVKAIGNPLPDIVWLKNSDIVTPHKHPNIRCVSYS